MVKFNNGKLLWFWVSTIIIFITIVTATAAKWTQVNDNTKDIEIHKVTVIEEIKELKTEMNEQFKSINEVMTEKSTTLTKIETNISHIQGDIEEVKSDVKELMNK